MEIIVTSKQLFFCFIIALVVGLIGTCNGRGLGVDCESITPLRVILALVYNVICSWVNILGLCTMARFCNTYCDMPVTKVSVVMTAICLLSGLVILGKAADGSLGETSIETSQDI